MMDVNTNICYTCSYYNLKDCYCEKYLKGKEKAVFLCPDCRFENEEMLETPTETPTDAPTDYDLSGYSDRLWKAAYERGKAEAQRRGKWIYLNGLDAFECSVCGRQMVRNIFDYCPWCGARMEEQEWMK